MRMMFGAVLGAAALTLVGTAAIAPASASEKSSGVRPEAQTAAPLDEMSSQRRRYRRYYGGPRYYYGGPRYYRPYGYARPYGYYGNPYYSPYGYYGRPRVYGPGFGFSFGF